MTLGEVNEQAREHRAFWKGVEAQRYKTRRSEGVEMRLHSSTI
jgi:hypothetical protein